MSLTRGVVLDIASQVGGSSPSTATLHDFSRHKNDGTLTDVTWTQEPTGLWVANFNGTSSKIVISNSLELAITTDEYTIITWIKTTKTDEQNICDMGYYNADGYELNIHGGGRLAMRTYQSGAGQVTQSLNTAIVADIWMQLVMVRSGANVTLYKTGADVTDSVGTHTNPVASARALKIGVRDDGSIWYSGKMGKFQHYNYALTPAQIRARYHSSKYLFGVAS